MLEMREEKPILFFNSGVEDKEAYLFIRSSGVSCEFRTPSTDVFTPLLLVGYKKFFGLNNLKGLFFIRILKPYF